MIVGFNMNSMEASKDGIGGGETDVNYSSGINDIEKAEVESLDGAVASISFDLSLDYEQRGEKVANISFDGNVLWRGDAEELVENWQEDEELDEDVAAEVTNYMYHKCITRAVGMADALDLPSPVPMPRVNR